MNQLIVCKKLHFVSKSGECCSAVIVTVVENETSVCNLTIFNDGIPSLHLETSVKFSEKHEPKTWHLAQPECN